MLIFAYLALDLIMVAGAIAAVLSKSLLQAAVALAVGSAALAALMFLLEAPHAGSFELSVGAGLISILFIVAISLTESTRRQSDES
ncbi:MAG: hydrogenase subunit MbhD domain-containing protein [Chloroflexota bacterium]|nr:hydrogenase subunit MbhD domain-containing protein [Chloroflexota bacterium]